jgi:hypothetical protein
MVVVMQPRPYREMLGLLRQYEGRRCLWRVAGGSALIAAVPALAVAGSLPVRT